MPKLSVLWTARANIICWMGPTDDGLCLGPNDIDSFAEMKVQQTIEQTYQGRTYEKATASIKEVP